MKKNGKKTRLLALLLMISVAFALMAGCDNASETETTEAEDEPYTVGVDLFYKSDEYYLDIEVCMRQKAEENGIELVVQNADTDLATQVQHVEDFITQGVDAIVISAVDPVGSYACVEAANKAGIPIFMFDGVTENTEGVTAHTIGDFVEEGEKAGNWAKKYIEENLNGEASYAVLDFFPSAIICGGRTQGFMSVLDEMESVTRVAHQDGKATREGGMTVMEDILTSSNNEVDLVFAINYESGAGAGSAIEAANADTKVICVSWNAEGFEKLENDDPIMKAYLLAAPPQEVSKIIDVTVQHLNGEEVEKEIFMESAVYDINNINELDWRSIVDARDN